jgi:hypothetical protein
MSGRPRAGSSLCSSTAAKKHNLFTVSFFYNIQLEASQGLHFLLRSHMRGEESSQQGLPASLVSSGGSFKYVLNCLY